MADQILDNSQLESVVEEFAKDRQKEKYARAMEILENSTVLVPVMRLPGDDRIMPCLLSKENGEQVFPIFTSAAQIPQDKMSPGLAAMPFYVCLSTVMENQKDVEAMVLNPFTHNMVLPKAILEVADKRRNVMGKPKQIKVTEKQLRQLVHNRMALHLLPKYLFEHKEEGLTQLQHDQGSFLLQFYQESYPENRKSSRVSKPEDFSVMTLNITEDMQITRVDMPNETNRKGMCYRVYAVRIQKTQEILYYTLEKTEKGNYIGQVKPDGQHELVGPVPDNGAEIEAVMNLSARPEKIT